MEIDMDGTLLVPLSELPVPSDKDEPRQQVNAHTIEH